MSFLDTLKNLGLWGGQAQGQPAQPQQNPYGLDPAMMRQAALSSIGNIGGQIMAMSQQMTAPQRAAMMANADWTGGMQDNLYNAAQMKLMGDASRKREQEQERMTRARAMIADKIKGMPSGRARDAAMYFFEAGDLSKAGEVLFTTKKAFDATTGREILTDYFGNPIGPAPLGVGGVAPSRPAPAAAPGGMAMPVETTPLPGPQVVPGAAPGPAPIPAPNSVGMGGPVNQLTMNWRQLTGDPNLTPAEAQQVAMAAAAEGNAAAGLKVHREIVKNRMDAANKDEDQAATTLNQDRGAAEKLATDFEAATKEHRKVVDAAQRAEEVAMAPNMSGADKLLVLYRYVTTLDPAGSVREGDTDLAQQILSVQQQIAAWYNVATSGGPVSDEAVLALAKTMGRLGTAARGNIERKRIETLGVAGSRKVPTDMVFGPTPRGGRGQYPEKPIGFDIGRSLTSGADPRGDLGLSQDDINFVRQFGG